MVAGFPFAFVLIALAWGLMRALGRDKLILYRQEQLYRSAEEVEVNTPSAIKHWEDTAPEPRTAPRGDAVPAPAE